MLRSIASRIAGVAEKAISKREFSKIALDQKFLQATKGDVFRLPALAMRQSALRPLGTVRHAHDAKAKGDDELISFLGEEIATEKKGQRQGPLPTKLDTFDVKLNQSEITLVKKYNSEELTITLNVNHTVDADYSEEAEQQKGAAEKDAEMRSRPNFEIDVKKGNQTLTFSCSYLQDPGTTEVQPDEYQDAFVIDEISLFQGEWNEQVYAVAGEILDGYLYDLFMNMLEERGVTNEFVEKLSDFATDYEHKLYVSMLGQLQSFLSAK